MGVGGPTTKFDNYDETHGRTALLIDLSYLVVPIHGEA